jgi:valyl-tRNA synthetase
MEIPKKFDPIKSEDKWYKHWMDKGYFNSQPDDREAYTVVIPPPNVTGVLHMGHMLNNTIQDVLVRKARMEGKNACWVPGTDHASIATEAKVVQKLRREGVKKSDLGREEFLQHAWDWTNEHGGIILEQLKKLGASCDWDRTRFTLDKKYSESVINTFIDLFNKGKIYRGERMVNWDPEATTALSDEEVIYKEVNSKLFYVRYKIEDTDDEWLVIATTRPETILGDSAICIHPEDERYAHLRGKRAIVPLVNRSIPIIEDDYIDMEFGTGCLKVTPAHDPNDYDLGIKHKLETINILDEKGKLNENAIVFVGEDRFEVRKKIESELDDSGYLVKVEDHVNKVGFSERTDAVIEPRLSLQWFCSMKELAQPALENVMNDNIKFYPSKFKNTYRHWMENIKDWCISRQLWWGHRIPAWYYGKGENDFVVAKTHEEALGRAWEKSGNQDLSMEDLTQDEDVLDTWFSSWLWPISVFDGFESEEEVNYYYPTNDLVTAPEIMFFWVARMIVAGYEYRGELPFKNVYYTGIVRDQLGRKMSKQLGNSPDPIMLMEKFGADGVRVGMLLASPAGNDLPFDSALCEQGRNFSNKVWNGFRLIKGWEINGEHGQPEAAAIAHNWFNTRLNQQLAEIDDCFSKFRISDALMAIYKLVWDDFCNYYLEMVKPGYRQPIDQKTYNQAIGFLDKILRIMHPFAPFISEEIWHLIDDREEDLIVAAWPKVDASLNIEDNPINEQFTIAADVISNIRTIRLNNGIANKVKVEMYIKTDGEIDRTFDPIATKMGNLSKLEYTKEKVNNAFSFVVKGKEYFIPFTEDVDMAGEREKLIKELDYAKGFLNSVQKKLANDRFVNNAPEQVVLSERKKEAETQSKIKILEEKLQRFE